MTENGRRLTVELAGLPGSGKSRRARILAGQLAAHGIRVDQPLLRLAPSVPTGQRLAGKALVCATAALAAPSSTARQVRGIAHSGQPRLRDLAGRTVQWLVARGVTERGGRESGVAVVDEGEVQALWSIGLRGDVEPVLAALATAPSRRAADLLAVVHVPPDVAWARLTARRSRHSRVQRGDGDRARAELERGARLLDRLVAWWPGRPAGSRSVVVLDGTTDDDPQLTALVVQLCAGGAAVGSFPR